MGTRAISPPASPPAAATTGLNATTRPAIVTVGIADSLIILGLLPITTAIPSLSAALAVETSTASWLLTVFILALAGSLIVAGRLGDLLGHRRIFGIGGLVYAGGALVCALAPEFGVLLLGRVAQGIGAAMVSGNNLAILTHAVPAAHRGRAIGVVTMVANGAGMLSAALVPFAVGAGAWRLLFLTVVPLALIVTYRSRSLPDTNTSVRPGRIDWLGAGILIVAIGSITLAISHPHGTASEVVMPVFHLWLPLVALAAVGAFVAVERRVEVPLLDWGQLRNARLAGAVVVNGILHLTMMGTFFLAPLLIEHGLRLEPVASGAMVAVAQAAVVGMALVGGWLYDRTRWSGLRAVTTFVLAISFVLWGLAGTSGSFVAVVGAGVLGGLCAGLLMAVNNTVLMGTLPSALRGVAAGMLETTRHFGHAFGVTIPTAIVAAIAVPAAGIEGVRSAFLFSCLLMAVLATVGVAAALAGRKQAEV